MHQVIRRVLVVLLSYSSEIVGVWPNNCEASLTSKAVKILFHTFFNHIGTLFISFIANYLIKELKRPIHLFFRDYPSTFLTSRRGQQLTLIQNLIHDGMKGDGCNLKHLPVDSVCNIERCCNYGNYSLGQLSVHYIQSSIRYNSVSARYHPYILRNHM